MSVVNKMLKDLEAREGVEQPQARYEAPQKKSVSALTIVVLLLVIVTIALAVWVLLNPAPSVSSAVLPSESMPITDTNEVSLTEQRPAILPASLTASAQPSTESAEKERAEKVSAEKVSAGQGSVEASISQNDDTNTPQNLSKPMQTSAQVAQDTSSEKAKATEGEYLKSPSSRVASDASINPTSNPDNSPTGIFVAKTVSKSVDSLKTAESAPVPRFSKQIDNNKNAPAIDEQVRLALDNNDYNTAIRLMQQKAQSHPTDISVKKKLASLLFASGQVEKAQALLQGMLVNSPDDHSVRLMLSRLYVKQGLTTLAIENANGAVSSPRNPLSVELLSFRANLLQQHGEFDKSLNDYLVLTKRRPLEPKWWLGAAISADSLHQSALAFHAFSQVVKIDTQQILSPNVHHYAQERMARLREVVK
ncbi:tetratricopeptide repeat protein [uncultured Alteromonas sp.]|jgi:MSHA biogenesis protein MshN|uniref:tetratricopeptide repeat protein n=1 Tax=uncultured Alteromonas sp. TaxID=179113 RepID=UPI00258DFB37|nr:tetratricopeptide repeat protein [uncultured Alteromonas sp.]